jgi:hypothetical protein
LLALDIPGERCARLPDIMRMLTGCIAQPAKPKSRAFGKAPAKRRGFFFARIFHNAAR